MIDEPFGGNGELEDEDFKGDRITPEPFLGNGEIEEEEDNPYID